MPRMNEIRQKQNFVNRTILVDELHFFFASKENDWMNE